LVQTNNPVAIPDSTASRRRPSRKALANHHQEQKNTAAVSIST